jgi:argonaute-like protein implicated in RNA metabolism and viral defense
MRLFDVSTSNAGRKYIYNPHEGDYYIIGNEGYLCSTGKVFLRNGSAQPLHIRKVYGSFPLDKCLEDIYYMTALTWTRPEGCMRDPITTKLNDRFLREEATDYDSDGLEFATYLADEVTT